MARVELVDLLDLDRGVGKEIVKAVVLIATVVTAVLPHDSEGEHLSVVVEEALQVFVGTATLEHDLDVVLVLGEIWGVLFHVDHRAGVHEGIIWEGLRCVQNDALVGIETAGELITIHDAEDSAVDVKVLSKVEVVPFVKFGRVARVKTWLGHQMALEEDALGDATVGDSWLSNVKGVVFEVVED